MSVLSQLQVTNGDDRSKGYDPVRVRRKKLAAALTDQLQLLGAAEEGGEYRKVKTKRVRDLETDEVVNVQQQRRVAPWWWFDDEGNVRFSVRYGSARLKIKDGMHVVVFPSLAQLKKLLPNLRKEVLSGGLDEALEEAAKSLQFRFRKGGSQE